MNRRAGLPIVVVALSITASAQQLSSPNNAAGMAGSENGTEVTLPAGAERVAQILAIRSTLGRLAQAPAAERPRSAEALAMRQTITEAVLTASLR